MRSDGLGIKVAGDLAADVVFDERQHILVLMLIHCILSMDAVESI